MNKPYQIIAPKGKKVPILVSVPHGGTAFPPELKGRYKSALANPPDDTDFFVQDLYDFVTDMGITIIQANYSRWVIDLNRSPENQALYSDGRIITALTPTTDFLGNSIYTRPEFEPNTEEVVRRKAQYFQPYYAKITAILNEFKTEFGKAILWDAHSIRQIVPTIQTAPFPDLILGTNDGKTASNQLIQTAKKGLKTDDFQLSYNHPFKGGNITRHFGNPANNIHALQLEMIKTLYMDDSETVYHLERANKIRQTLKNTFDLLINVIK